MKLIVNRRVFRILLFLCPGFGFSESTPIIMPAESDFVFEDTFPISEPIQENRDSVDIELVANTNLETIVSIWLSRDDFDQTDDGAIPNNASGPDDMECIKVVKSTEHTANQQESTEMQQDHRFVFDADTDAKFAPPDGWVPDVNVDPSAKFSSSEIANMLRIAHIAKRGAEFSCRRPIDIETAGQNIVIRFPADTNAPSGFRYRGPTWTATVVLDAVSLQVVSVSSDAD